MKIYITADMEGVTGVTHSQDVIPGRSQYERFRGLLTADVNAAIEFATASSAASVLFFSGLERVDDRRVSWTHEDFETAFKMFIGVMRLSRSDPDYG